MDGGRARRWVVAWTCALAVGAAGCGDADGDPGCGGGPAPFVPEEGACDHLSTYGMLSLDGEGRVVPEAGVHPYRPATELFSDYAVKARTVHVPSGEAVRYDDGELVFPEGTVLTKTFAFPADLRAPDRALRVIETRLLIRRGGRWEPFPYLWDEDQTEAHHRPAGAAVPVSWVHLDGTLRSTTFAVPSRSQCVECHGQIDEVTGQRVLTLLGARARHLNAPLDPAGFADVAPVPNQLAQWADEGWLEGLPADLGDVPRAPAWNDPEDGTLHHRARAYLDLNCAHCHNAQGGAGTSSRMRLNWEVEDPSLFGVCLANEVLPGNPDGSRMVSRMSATSGTRVMPRIGRSVVHEEGVALIREWIDWLATPEAADMLDLDPAHYDCL
jgi:uncharacterized repeat protein (TIGR03806 family)